jgi:hypothetical protein
LELPENAQPEGPHLGFFFGSGIASKADAFVNEQ